MSHVISGIHRISNSYSYVPGITETSGFIRLGEAGWFLGEAGILKVHEYYTDRKNIFPADSHFRSAMGAYALIDGVQKIAPASAVVLAIYALRGKWLRGGL